MLRLECSAVRAVGTLLVVVLLSAIAVVAQPPVSEAAAGNVAPVEATYHGVLPYNTFSVGQLQYDAWTYGDIVFYSPPGMVTQEMANQWLAWYATTDDILRALTNNDALFEDRFRGNDPNFGWRKVIGTPPDSCGAGCGNKTQAEGVGIIDAMVADPDNFEHHWILFYEQARGGRDAAFDLSASWPRENYVLPHLVAALTFYEIGGMPGLERGVPGDIYNGLQDWIDWDTPWVEQFVEREQRFFTDQYPNGDYIYPPAVGIYLHIAVDDGYEAVASIFHELRSYPDNLRYDDSTQAICDFRAAINDGTNNRYDAVGVDDWGLPAECSYDMGQGQSVDSYPNDLRFSLSGQCADPLFKPNTAIVGLFPCNGSPEQQVTFVDIGDDKFRIEFGDDAGCFDEGSPQFVIVWGCHGQSQQHFQIEGNTIQAVGSERCVTARPENRWGGGLLTLEPCAGSPEQQVLFSGAGVRGGDVNCDGTLSIVDAVLVARFTVGVAGHVHSCFMARPNNEISAADSDRNGDGQTTIADAVIISQCVVGIDNGFCS